MRGKANIINTAADFVMSSMTRDQAIAMATIQVRYDDAEYPDGYDENLTEADEGYIAPVYRFESEIDQAVLDRLGIQL